MPTFRRAPPIALLMIFFLAAGCSRLIGADFDRGPPDGGGKDASAQNDAQDAVDTGDSGDADSRPPLGENRDAQDASDAQDTSDAQDASDAVACGPCSDNQICCAGTCKRIDATNCFDCGAACGATRPVCDLDARVCVCTATSCPNGQICCGGTCKPIDATNCFACGAACGSTQPACALDVQTCACTATSCPNGQVCVAGSCLGSSVLPLAPRQPWTRYPFHGNEQTSFADVDHDGRADAIAVDDSGITVYHASPNGGFFYKGWIRTGPFTGAHGTLFADVTGDGCADAIAVGESSVIVRRSNCTNAFGPSEVWGPSDPTILATTAGDVNGDGCADLIDLDPDHVKVRLASPCPVPMSAAPFSQPAKDWTDIGYLGDVATFVADVTGDGKADAIVLNRFRFSASNGIVVRRSDGTQLLPNEHWSLDTLETASAALAADVTGDGMADLVAVKPDGAYMLRSDRWFLGGREKISDWPFSPSPSILGGVFALADVTGDGRADLIQVDDDAIWVNVTVDRQIPIRFVQLVADAASALAPERLADAVAAANAVHLAAGLQFFISGSTVVASPALADLTGSGSATPNDLAAATSTINGACSLGGDLDGLPALQQMAMVATRCALDGEIVVYVAHVASSTAQLPWEGRAFFMDPRDLTASAPSRFRLAHELGHYLGLPHVFGCCGDTALSQPDLVSGNIKDPSTGFDAPLSLFWDLVYAPSGMTNRMFDSSSEAAVYESSLTPIQATNATTDLTSGWYCPSADASRACDASAPAGTICVRLSDPQGEPKNYCSGEPELKGLGLRLPDDTPTVNVMSFGYRLPMPDPSDVARRQPTLSLSQIEQIHRVLTYDVNTRIPDAAGRIITGGRPLLGR